MADITVEGQAYELPALDTISIDESKIIKRHSGMTLDQLFELEGLDGGAIGGLLAVAIKRADPNRRDADIDAAVGQVNLFAVMEELAANAEETPDPTQAEAPPSERDSKPSSNEPTESSGDSGSDVSGLFPVKSSPASTGLPVSDGVVVSDHKTSAA